MSRKLKKRGSSMKFLRGSSTPITSDEDKRLMEDLEMRLVKWKHGRHSDCSIYAVPERFRRANEEAYTPRLISIGPLHYGKEHLQAMEAHKMRYLWDFLCRPGYGLDFYVTFAKTWEKRARRFYHNLHMSSDEFVRIIFVDSIFIVELLMRYANPETMREEGDFFQKEWVRIELRRDLTLLENQLPFSILEYLFDRAPKHLKTGSFRGIAYQYFRYDKTDYSLDQVDSKINHIVHLIYSCFLPPNLSPCAENDVKYFNFENTRSAAELHAAGVKFKVRRDWPTPVDIKFTNGTLEIPRLRVSETTEPFFRNLIAYEQCHHDDRIISSYIMLMDVLINTPKDVDILVRHNIIKNLLDDNEYVCFLFNNLYKRTITDGYQFYYANLCEELNAYSKDFWHQLKAEWYRSKKIFEKDYLSNPWKFISVIAAVILLGLTIIQAVCSIMSLKISKH